jgi:hypothetical protein
MQSPAILLMRQAAWMSRSGKFATGLAVKRRYRRMPTFHEADFHALTSTLDGLAVLNDVTVPGHCRFDSVQRYKHARVVATVLVLGRRPRRRGVALKILPTTLAPFLPNRALLCDGGVQRPDQGGNSWRM